MTIKTFVLIYLLVQGGAATGAVEFSSLGECERAAQQMKAAIGGYRSHVCVEKTTIPVAR